MKCPKCQKASMIGAEYCVWCGTSLFGGAGRGQSRSEADGLPEIKQHLSEMAVRLSKVEGRVALIGERTGLEVDESPAAAAAEQAPKVELQAKSAVEPVATEVVAPEPLPPVPVLEPTPVTPETLPAPAVIETAVVQETVASGPKAEVEAESVLAADKVTAAAPTPMRLAPARVGETPPVAARPPQKPPQPPQPSHLGRRMREWEQSLPGNWLSRIGMLALFIGLGFLTQWAYANDKLVRLPLLLVGLACGGVLLFAGHHWRKNYGAWAQALTGGGIGVLYMSFFASYALYDHPVMSLYPTFGLMLLVTVLAVGIALRRESMAIAIIGIVGAFLVPIILNASDMSKGSGGDTETNPGLMIAYILALDAGIVGLSAFRKWRWFTLLGFAGSLAVYGLWYATSGYDGTVAAAQWSLTGIFLCFAAATTLFHVVWRRTPKLADLALMSLNAAVYFCVSYGLLWGEHQVWLGLFSVGMSALYAMTGYLAWRRSDENRRLSLFAFAIGIVFLTIAIPVQLHRSYASWITAAWAVEGAALIWIAVRQKMPKWQLWGLGAFGMALFGLIVFNGVIDEERFRPFINDTFWAFTISILAFYAGAWCLRRKKDALQPWFFPAMMLTASVLTLWLFSGEIVSAAGSEIIEAHDRGATFLDLRNIGNARSLGLVGLWVAYGLGMLFVGARKKWDWLRISAYGLMAVACALTVVVLNHGYAMVRIDSSNPVVNYAFGGFAICTLGMYLAARIIAENRERLHSFESSICTVALVAANLFTVSALSAEIVTFVRHPESLRDLLLVGLWMGYGCLVMVVGVWRKALLPRLGAYALMVAGVGATVLLLNHWHAGINPEDCSPIVNYSFAGFAICTIALYLVARVIADNRERLHKSEDFVGTAALVAANVLTVCALSAEIVTFVNYSVNLRNLLLVALWMAYGCLLTVVGVWRKALLPRLGGYALMVAGVGATVVLLGQWHADVWQGDLKPIVNFSFAGFAICTLALYLVARVIAENRDKLQNFEKLVCIVALVAANVLTLWALSAEIVTFINEPENLRNSVLVTLWVGYGCSLMAVGIWRQALLPRIGACALMCLGIGATGILLNHWWAEIGPENSNPIINYSFGAFAVCTIGLYLVAYLTARPDGRPSRFNQVVYPLALGLASVLTIGALSAEVITFLPDENLRNLVLVILWSGYGLLLMLAGVWKGVPAARFGGYGLMAAAAALALTMLNHSHAGIYGTNSNWVANYSFGGLCICVSAIYLAAYLVAIHRGKLLSGEKMVLPALVGAANAMSLYALSMEVWTYAGSASGKSMGLTMLWAAYGIVLVVVGILGKWARVRLGGLALVSVAVLKLFILDTLVLDPPYRVAAYITVGVLLLAGGFVYHRFADVIKGFIMDRPEKGAGAAQK